MNSIFKLENLLYHYNLFKSKSSISINDKKISEINSALECASQCDNEKGIQCKSFNHCPASNTCYLSSSHFTDSSNLESSGLSCDHYSS